MAARHPAPRPHRHPRPVRHTALRRTGQLLRALLAATALAALIAGVPWGLTRYIGWPLPHHMHSPPPDDTGHTTPEAQPSPPATPPLQLLDARPDSRTPESGPDPSSSTTPPSTGSQGDPRRPTQPATPAYTPDGARSPVPGEDHSARHEPAYQQALKLTVLGRMRLTHHQTDGGEHADLSAAIAPKQREVLAYLAVQRDGARREALTNAIWPDAPTDRPTTASTPP